MVNSGRFHRLSKLFFLLVVALGAYFPVWHGGPVWDDDGHLTSAGLQSMAGLKRIWLDLSATQQYYPLTHSAFWLLNRIAGSDMLAYHVTNITLHALSAWVLILMLERLRVPGATLAGVLFALHPVQVESVAWITELKNTLSGLFYLCAALAYLHFDEHRRPGWHATAFVLFLLALASKSVTATLPAGLLVVFWWQRGRLRWRQDVVPLLPFFAAAAGSGAFTAWVERTYIGARGEEFHFSLVERLLIAGRAIWFYLGKLIWPVNLTFVYPRWQIDATAGWQYLLPIGVVVLFVVLWRLRRITRAPAAALMFFIVTLSPALGFVNVFPFRFSFVADHFQYLACIGVMALVAAAVAGLLPGPRGPGLQRPGVHGPGLQVLIPVAIVLAVLTWRQSHEYVDAETLYRATLEKNPNCWMAYNNLGAMRLAGGSKDDLEAGMALVQKAIALNPNDAEAHNNIGFALYRLGRFDEARTEHDAAVRLSPAFAAARANLGADLLMLGRLDEALAIYRALRPEHVSPETHDSLGTALLKAGRLDEAVHEYEEAIRARPDFAEVHNNLGMAWERRGQFDRALAEYTEAVRLKPDAARAHDNLGFVLLRTGHADDARPHFEEALRLDPRLGSAHYNLANVLLDRGRFEEAIAHYREAIALDSGGGSAEAHNNLGVALMQQGRTSEGIREFQTAVQIDPGFPNAHQNLARALRHK
jgi:protein O-mannosyl-transferase